MDEVKIPIEKTMEVEMPPISAPPFRLLQSSSVVNPISDSDLAIDIFTTHNPAQLQDSWLPITESRNGNAYHAAFHTLNSGIGAQALLLPLAFISLGWTWGITSLSLAFVWQLYTLWLLIQMHESDTGIRYSRYIHLSMAAFGEKKAKLFTFLPTMYLASGTCVTLLMIGGETMKIFFNVVCGDTCGLKPLTTIEWYLVFICTATILAQLPNLNSIAAISLAGSIAAITYCTLIWVISVTKTQLPAGNSDNRVAAKSEVNKFFDVLTAIGIIAFAFRGHNLVLEIQGTLPSSRTRPTRLPMWRGVKFSYTIIAFCLFPLAIVGYWAYGNHVPSSGGIFSALYKYHKHDTPKGVMGLISLLVVIHCLSSFQIYGMPVFDKLESIYTNKAKQACPRWVRTTIRIFFGCMMFFIAVALPFLRSLASLIGGIALPITMAYPCFMWNLMKKPRKHSAICILNWVLGVFGVVLSVLVIAAAIWTIVTVGIKVHFFKVQ